MQRLLIDECLSSALVQVAVQRGYQADFVPHVGKSGMKDWHLVAVIEQGSYLFVTNNRQDFLGLHGAMPIHEGLMVIIPSVNRAEQVRLFSLALDRLETLADLVNQVMEVDAKGGITIRPLASTGG